MTESTRLDSRSHSLLDAFFSAHDIHSIRVSTDADIRDEEASLVDIHFAAGEETGEFRANFK